LIALHQPGIVHWGTNGWRAIRENPAQETGLGFLAAVLDTSELSKGQQVDFTIRRANGDWIAAD
jgi:glucoamylase